jgi:hypothetical protein
MHNTRESIWWCVNLIKKKKIEPNDSNLCIKYIHEIRNFNVLDEEMIDNIRLMTNEEKMNIITSLNDIFDYLKKCQE